MYTIVTQQHKRLHIQFISHIQFKFYKKYVLNPSRIYKTPCLSNSCVEGAERRAGELDVREPSTGRQQAHQHDSVAVRILSTAVFVLMSHTYRVNVCIN